jgi:DNA-directed RNA polymerase alpha subunit
VTRWHRPARPLRAAGATGRRDERPAAGLELGEVRGALSGSPDLDLPIEDLELSERPATASNGRRSTPSASLLQKTEDDLLAITNFGQKSLDEVIAKLDERGLRCARATERAPTTMQRLRRRAAASAATPDPEMR